MHFNLFKCILVMGLVKYLIYSPNFTMSLA